MANALYFIAEKREKAFNRSFLQAKEDRTRS
jgi:hypothetical protein